MRNARYKNGMTLVELLVALVVTGVVFTAVATLAFAVSTATNASDDTSYKQARVRFATLKISEMIKNCKFVYDERATKIVLWQNDDNGDGVVDSNEQAEIDIGRGRDRISISEGDGDPVDLIPLCRNVEFRFDDPSVAPRQRKFVSIIFELSENDVWRQYQINAALRSWAGHLLDDTGAIVGDDD